MSVHSDMAHDLREAVEDRRQRKDAIQRRVGDGNPCGICGALVPVEPEALRRHARWHFDTVVWMDRVDERLRDLLGDPAR